MTESEEISASFAVNVECNVRNIQLEGISFASSPNSTNNFFVKATDIASDRSVKGLSVSDFIFQENGTRLLDSESFFYVNEFSGDVSPINQSRVAIVVDISRSVSNEVLDQVKASAIDLVQEAMSDPTLGQIVEIAIYSFDGDITEVLAFSSEYSVIASAIQNLGRGGISSNLYGAIEDALSNVDDKIVNGLLEVGSVVVFTDGQDTSGLTTAENVSQTRGDKSLYFILHSDSADLGEMKLISGEVFDPTDEERKVFFIGEGNAFAEAFFARFRTESGRFSGGYSAFYASPKRSGQHEAKLSVALNTCSSSTFNCSITGNFNAFSFTDEDPVFFENWPRDFLSSTTQTLQIQTLWSDDAPNYTWNVVSADPGMTLTVDSFDNSIVSIAAPSDADDALITFEVTDNNFPTLPPYQYTLTASDGVLSAIDTCPTVFDPDQTDTDGDGVGDACVSVNIALLLDIDGSGGRVNTFDILMIQRHIGGVSNLSTNIQLPTGVGGSGANGAYTNAELSQNITSLLAGASLDVDGDTDTDTFDLLMIQRYIGGVSNLATNIKLVERVGGSGLNGARTNAELRAAVAKVVGF